MNQPRSSAGLQTNSKKGRTVFRAGDIVNSQVIIGDHNISINGDGNTIINKVVPNQRPKITRTPSPVMVGRPSHPIFLLDREEEKKAANSTLRSRTPLQFFCPSGFGKSTLLRFLSFQAQLPDGMVFLEMRNQMTLDDLFQELFAAFYKSNIVYIPKQVEYKVYFEKITALILLDDVSLAKEEIQTLQYALPNCVFMMASTAPQLLGQGNVIELNGLPLKHSVALFQQQVGRKLNENELPYAQKICEILRGQPLYIIEAAAAVRFDGNFLDAVAQHLQSQSPQDAILQQSLRAIPDSEKRLLSILAVLGTAPLPADLMAEMLQTNTLAPLVKDLLERGLIKAHSPRYSLTGSLDVYLNKAWNLSPWRESVLRYFVDWSVRPLPSEKILDASEALFKVIEDAAGVNRWQEVLQIGQAVEPAFVLGGRWGAWSRLLMFVLRASQALGERAIEAWALHQLGSRALCLGHFKEAGEFLSHALEIRKAIGDRSGMSATQHNLTQLPGGTPPPRKPPSRGGPTSGKGWIIPIMGLVIATIAILVPILSSKDVPHFPVSVANTPTFTPLPTSSRTVTPSQMPSHTVTPSFSPTFTETPSYTPSPTFTLTPRIPPPAPLIISPKQDDTVVCSGQTIYLLWNEPYDLSSIDGYQVALYYYDRYFNNDWQSITNTRVNKTQLDITSEVSMYCGSLFSWRVVAINHNGDWGDWSPWNNFYTDFPAPPAAPANFSASFTRHDCSVLLGWDDVSNEDGYRVYRDGSLLVTLPADTVSYLDTSGGYSGGGHTYYVQAYNVSGVADSSPAEGCCGCSG